MREPASLKPLRPDAVSALEIDSVHKKYGDFDAVRGVSLNVPSGTILSLLGPSGCGKTTVLRMVAGLSAPTSGAIRFDGEDVTAVPPHRRNVGMVFQSYALFPHMSVADNVAFGLRMRGVSRAEIRPQVERTLALVQMGAMAERFPAELSGGQQQRVSLARAIVTRPRLLLLDEPFGALDRKLREEMQIEVKQLQRELGLTFIFVTHDQEEALTLSDMIAVMRAGRLEQVGSPSDVYDRPQSHFAAEFFGTLNTLKVEADGSGASGTLVECAVGKWLVSATQLSGKDALFAVRATDTLVAPLPDKAEGGVEGTIEDTIYKGNTMICRVRLADGSAFVGHADPSTRASLNQGAAVRLSWPADKAFVFPAQS
jgi:spermidine/putrescine ABC transporter ATP-binding subunit